MAGLIKAGQPVAVQVTRDAYKDKGASVTTKITWPGRFFVIEKNTETVARSTEISISKKITSEAERARLTRIANELLEQIELRNYSIIIRTDAANAASSFLEAELTALSKAAFETDELLHKIKKDDFDKSTLPITVYKPYASVCMMLAANLMSGSDVREIVINDEEEYALLSRAYSVRGIKVTLAKNSVFYTYNLSKAYDTTKQRLVHLPSGGRIIIDKTEACVVIDVNSAQYSGRKTLEDMALKINIEAAHETARQLRLRNLGGVILIDFINMKEKENVETLITELKAALFKDPALTVVEGMTRLGFMEMTRKKR
jgi:ribonuclease G